ncbi:MAG: class I SAM-dependent methyltransferase [Desulfobacterales bacterium]|nr:class I SAM-dependent methyltransferase [Desulfobacterales bacterium]
MKDTRLSKIQDILRCPKCHGKLETDSTESSLTCQSDRSHSYPIIDGIPSFVKREEVSPDDAYWVFDYDETAEEYDEGVKLYDEWLGVDLMKEFKKAIEDVPVKHSSRVLDMSTGTGNIIFGLRELHQETDCIFVGVDLSIGMLRVAQRKFLEAQITVPLLHTQVMQLPFDDNSFDVLTHSGGINTFSDIPATLKEWVRVLKPDGFLWIGDEGISPALRKTRRGAEIMNKNKLFGLQPPLRHLPPKLKNINLRWLARDTFYKITCQKLSEEELREVQPLKVWFNAEM